MFTATSLGSPPNSMAKDSGTLGSGKFLMTSVSSAVLAVILVQLVSITLEGGSLD